jgi:glycerophosphoryl diester phosphodiesterase
MGGSGGGPSNIGNIKSLIDRAKKVLRDGEEKGRRNVFISFDHADLNNVNLLRGQAKRENSTIDFNDWSVSEPFDSERVTYIQGKIKERIEQSSLTIVYLSDKTSESRWVEWEIEESLRQNKHVIGVFVSDKQPDKLPDAITRNSIECVPWSKLAETIEKLK